MDEAQGAQEDFQAAEERWRRAIDAHRLAPPDAGFSARLAELAAAAHEEARACRRADAAGFQWPPHRAQGARPPYELQPGTGRRGSEELWRAFDAAAAQFNHAAAGTDLLEVARAHDLLGDIAEQLAADVQRLDRASGLLAPVPRRRRSA